MRRRAFAGALAVLASVLAGGAAPRADAATTGTISGTIAVAGTSIAPRVAEIESNLRIVARTGDGTSVGTLRFGAVRDDAAGTSVLTYAIANVPLGRAKGPASSAARRNGRARAGGRAVAVSERLLHDVPVAQIGR